MLSRKGNRPSWDVSRIRKRLQEDGFEWVGRLPQIAWFGDTPELANALGQLVRHGQKRATSSLLWRWLAGGGREPLVGHRQVIVDWTGEPLAVIEMTEVTVTPFDQVEADFARDEGEGDLSLDYWRKIHYSFFSRECERLRRAPTPQMPVVCMRFRVLHAVSG